LKAVSAQPKISRTDCIAVMKWGQGFFLFSQLLYL